ncbi:MAG: Asp-tRNA(Asn)/Glu-tRNA(Gln) amidotransferase subunit GatA [Planctomycetes bacterium]|nr:Asp-tRNA(Asn)/Glu-tRNA(Gln) amidotransferase subunit GatA [Planctomycetota bacterium]
MADAVRARRASATEVAKSFLDRAAALNPSLFAFIELQRDDILAQARAIDTNISNGKDPGALAGVPVAIKDILCIRGGLVTCGSKILKNYRAPYDATVIRKLRDAGAILYGRTNMDEFAMGSSTEHSCYGPTRNPWDTTCVPGGSSGGSAAAVAARLAPLSLGTDTGGSIRQPASLCGIVGLKPTYGRVSRYGLIAFASSLDQIGPFATNIDDCALITEILCGVDPRDSTSVDAPVPDLRAAIRRGVNGLRIGVPKQWMTNELDSTVRESVNLAIDGICAAGATRVEVDLPRAHLAIPTYYLVATAEASSNLARFDGIRFAHRASGVHALIELYGKTRDEGFGEEVKRRILLGTFVLSAGYAEAYYNKALQVRRLLKDDFENAFAHCDVIAGPASPTPTFEIGSKSNDPLSMYLCDLFTAAINLVGLPGISVPCGFAKGKNGPLPLGLQIVAPALREDSIFAAAAAHESATDWHRRIPAGFET